MKENIKQPEYRIRPSARLISTIGKDLVKDKFAAVVELVKNSFDADSPDAKISFIYNEENQTLTISVADSGHGMDLDTVVNKWLVPATSDKLERKTSAEGRALQGRKGIGRFAAAALGSSIYLNTKAKGHDEVSLLLDLDDFSSNNLLEDIPIVIDQVKSNRKAGTFIEVVSTGISVEDLNSQWDEKQRGNLVIELSTLLAPSEVAKVSKELGYLGSEDSFTVSVEYKGFPDMEDSVVEVKPFGVIDLFDYRIHGTINSDGYATFEYYNQNVKDIKPERYQKNILLEDHNNQDYPGKISFDLRVFDRDPEAIDDLIERGLQDPFSDEKVGKRKARKILDEYYGVSIFRGSFRVRPYGDQNFDWLQLDSNRVQNPSMRIGHNQIIGFVGIQSEELSHLEEKSARDGLVEDRYFSGLKHLILYAISQLEEKRFEFRKRSFRGRKTKSVNDRIEDLFNFDDVTKNLVKKIGKLGIDEKSQQSIFKIVTDEIDKEQKKKSQEYIKVRETIALYQGQATLGKITHIVLHEGRKHIKVINEVPGRLIRWAAQLSKEFDDELQDKLTTRGELLVKSSKAISLLFKRIEPLAITRRPNRKQLCLLREVISSINIFESDLERAGISVHIDIPEDIEVYATSFDLATILANLVENSMYWLGISDSSDKEISVEGSILPDGVELLFSDNGPGFQGSNLELMFEPGFSMKPEGTGLGLALVGEAVERLNGTIRAASSEQGACFVINFNKG
ncbi:ATP-binding protein [Aestuariicella sp. G3-2]|uniref:sensor histidine kinase n=1 Tax=Pseudomaricurvus albidus TaxID=2842452 RepID=UPI001C0E5ECF|nr:sensor histidine kinase [Aestuariicella albida]MBU3068571.1 ATP-binding protein [Aestuariicella albida]